MHHLNKVVYSLGLATLLYLAEEYGRKRGYKKGLDFCYKSLLNAAQADPDKTLQELFNDFRKDQRNHHADD